MPESVEMPAPVSTVTRDAASTHRATSSTTASEGGGSGTPGMYTRCRETRDGGLARTWPVARSLHDDVARSVASAMTAGTIAMWHWFSVDQAITATTLARQAAALCDQEPDEEVARRYQAYAIGAVLSSAAFLEATCNEVLASAAHANLPAGGELEEDERAALVDAADVLDRQRLLERYQEMLHLVGRELIDEDSDVFVDVDLLLRLRQALVHFKP